VSAPAARPGAERADGARAGAGLVVESATSHVEVLVCAADGAALAHEREEVALEHTRRLAPLAARALAKARVEPRRLAWVAADLGPGSFTGVRVGLATAEAFALAAGARLTGASSLAALAHSSGARRALVVPLVPGGRRDLYAGFFRADAHGAVTLLAAPRVGPPAALLEAVAEASALLPAGWGVRFVGPGAARERDALERAWPGATEPPWRFEGLSALDLAAAVRLGLGRAAGLPGPDDAPQPLYVRSAQAEERVRRAALAGEDVRLRDMAAADLPRVAQIERRCFGDPWPESFFRGELAHPLAWARVAEHRGEPAGYIVAWLDAGGGHIGNLAVTPESRRHGLARLMLEELLERARRLGTPSVTLEVRVANDAAQALYRAHGFRLAGLRRGYYRDDGEDALVMEWRGARSGREPETAGPGRRPSPLTPGPD